MSIQNTFVKETLKSPHIIQYVRNKNGYLKGVVVTFGKGKYGWSLVNPEDCTWKREVPHNIPAIRHQLVKGKDWNAIVPTPLFQRLAKSGFVVEVPEFDKEYGLKKAIGRAMSAKTDAKVREDGVVEIVGEVILDNDLLEALEYLAKRVAKTTKLFA